MLRIYMPLILVRTDAPKIIFFLIHRNYLCIVIKALDKTFSPTNIDITVKFLFNTVWGP